MPDLTDCFERQTVPVAWTVEELDQLMRLRSAGHDWSAIARALGRTESGVKSKFKYELHSRQAKAPAVPFQRDPVPPSVLAEQAKRLSAAARDLTGWVLGDPPRGFSALDRRVRA